jgi:predicted small metal-binding protein
MKTMTCAQLGGPCEEKISGNTADELMANGMKHLEAAHPQMAADVKAAPKDDPKMVEWSNKFKADWENTPDSA